MNKREREIIKDYADSIKTEIKSITVGGVAIVPLSTDKDTVDPIEEGDSCPEAKCTGSMVYKQTTCCCSTINNPPCSACENSWLECDTCNYNPNDIPF